MSGAGFYEAVQQAVQQTVAAGKPSDYCLGTVETVNPLSIRINPKDLIKEEYLILTDAVRDYSVDISVSHATENRSGGSGDAAFASHNHDYVGRKKITVHNALHPGELVILLQQQGGQQYCVLSRVHDHTNLSGQWI